MPLITFWNKCLGDDDEWICLFLLCGVDGGGKWRGGEVIGDRRGRIDVLLVQYNIFWQVVKIAYIGQVLPYYIWQESVQYFGQGSFPPRLLIT